VIALNETGLNARCEQLGAGAFVYYPAFQFHTIRNATAKPITYLMFKWTGPPQETEAPFETTISRTEDIWQIGNAPFATQLMFEGPTHYLTKLQVHLTELQAGAGYAKHADAHDVAIVVLSGSVKTSSPPDETAWRTLFSGRRSARHEKPGFRDGALSSFRISRVVKQRSHGLALRSSNAVTLADVEKSHLQAAPAKSRGDVTLARVETDLQATAKNFRGVDLISDALPFDCNPLHRRCAWFYHWRSGRDPRVGGSALSRLAVAISC